MYSPPPIKRRLRSGLAGSSSFCWKRNCYEERPSDEVPENDIQVGEGVMDAAIRNDRNHQGGNELTEIHVCGYIS